jgi:hypothetical protein
LFTVDNITTPAQFALEMLEQNKTTPYNPKSYQEHAEHMESKKHRNETEFLFEGVEKRNEAMRKLSKFSEVLSENLLQECFCTIFDKIMEAERCTKHETAIGHSMISKLIKEEGISNLLRRFEHKSLVLSEFARFTEKYHKIAMEAVRDKINIAPDDDSCHVLDKEIAQRFIDDVSDLVPERTIDVIRDRVEDAMQEFIDQNTENKIAIKDIYLKAKMAVDKSSSDAVKEEHTMRAKGLAARVYEKPTNVFGAMVKCVGEAVVATEALKKEYMDGNKIKMEHLCNDVRIMYTVLEMANTLNIVNVNEAYIKQIIIDLKE